MSPLPLSPVLVIDSASPQVVVGLDGGTDDAKPAWSRHAVEAGIGVFAGVEEVLRLTGTTLARIRAVVFCEGPGSLLGVRIAAMAIRTWNATRAHDVSGAAAPACFAYRSLELAAADLVESGQTGAFSVITDARRSAWNTLEVSADGAFSGVRRTTANELETLGRPLFHPVGFALWQPLPPGTQMAPYRPEEVLRLARKFPLLQPCAQPDAFLTETPEYRKTTVPTPPGV
jgi:tRNA threonylcarbamoyladenosine biosynthesis protein TsaB